MSALSYGVGLMLSAHVGFCDDCNEVHPMVWADYAITPQWTAQAFAYHNSHRSLSAGLGLQYTIPQTPLFVSAGALVGYDRYAPVVPLARAGVALGDYVKLFAVPSPTSEKVDEWSVIGGVEMRVPF